MRQLLDQIVSSRDERLGVTERTRHQHERISSLHRTVQAAIGQQLKKEYEPPTELTAELATILAKKRRLGGPRHFALAPAAGELT
jgi:hypothetical protein